MRSILPLPLIQTLSAFATTMHLKDAYTDGHQLGVSSLARTLAQMLGCSHSEIECIRVCGLLHDIGKLGIPGDILLKSSQLTGPEFDVIKTHSALGGDILKDIDFPWPVATIIRHHHERMDGSGYPDGLKGEETHFAARIIGVADVVHAMMHPRVYRQTSGVDFAMDEIERNKGTLYDSSIVEACLKLFREEPERLNPEYYGRPATS